MAITCYDVKIAVLNADVDQDVYMYIPPGFPTKVFKLNKALYGLRQSPRLWNHFLTKILKQFEMKQSSVEPCFLFKKVHDLMQITIFFGLMTLSWYVEIKKCKMNSKTTSKHISILGSYVVYQTFSI